jgi:carbonic anhydrase
VLSPDCNQSRARLLAGVRRFQRVVYPDRRSTYEQVVRERQRPHALFITCADSRIDPELITQSGPGEIFVCRNIGNIVPAWGEGSDDVSAIVEYAIRGLEVSQVVICGHTDCGAMIGLLHPGTLARLSIVESWLHHADAAIHQMPRHSREPDENHVLLELIESNVLLQLDHMRTHPCVAQRLANDTLALSGWVYDIGQGIVSIYDEQRRRFLPVSSEVRAVADGAME